MKTRIIHTKFFTDPFVTSLDPVERWAFLYLITNEHVNIIHLYECSDRQIMFDTGLTKTQLAGLKEKLEEAGKVFFFSGFIFLKNAAKYETYSGDKNEAAKEKLFSQIPSVVLGWYKSIKDTPMDRGMDTGPIGTINHKSEIINHNSKIINQKSENISEKIEKKYSKISDLTDEDFIEIAEKYNVPLNFVKLQFEKLKNYCESKGRVYKNYKSALRNFVLGDAQRMAERNMPKNDRREVR